MSTSGYLLDEVLIPQFTHRLLPLDLATVRCWGELTAAARANGTPVGAVDARAVEVVDPWAVVPP